MINLINITALGVILAVSLVNLVGADDSSGTSNSGLGHHLSGVAKRLADHKHGHDDDKHTKMMHSHLSRKVFDRACAASKDTIDEIVNCIKGNETLLKVIKPEVAAKCYEDAFGKPFDPKEMDLHKELICKNREKFEDMTACVYRKTAEAMKPQEMDTVTSAMVDVGLCIINALDG